MIKYFVRISPHGKMSEPKLDIIFQEMFGVGLSSAKKSEALIKQKWLLAGKFEPIPHKKSQVRFLEYLFHLTVLFDCMILHPARQCDAAQNYGEDNIHELSSTRTLQNCGSACSAERYHVCGM